MTTEELNKLLEVAASWVGYLEKVSPDYRYYETMKANAGRGNFTRFGRIADYIIHGREVRGKDGHPWCASFLLACLYESKAGHIDTTAPAGSFPLRQDVVQWMRDEIANGQPLTYFAGCAAWHGAARQYGGVTSTPARGAFVLFLDASGKPYHIGIVEKVIDPSTFVTIEGNTNWSGPQVDPNGGAVARKTRKNKGVVFLNRHLLHR